MPKSTGVCIQSTFTTVILIVFITFNIYIFIKKLAFLNRAILIKGKIIKSENTPHNEIARYFKNVEFESENGKTLTVQSVFGSTKDRYIEGKSINVLYDSKKSKKAVIKSFKNIWGFELIIFFSSLAGLLLYFYRLNLITT